MAAKRRGGKAPQDPISTQVGLPKSVLIYSLSWLPGQVDGIAVRMMAQVQELVERGVKVTLMVPSYDLPGQALSVSADKPKHTTMPGVELVLLDTMPMPVCPGPKRSRAVAIGIGRDGTTAVAAVKLQFDVQGAVPQGSRQCSDQFGQAALARSFDHLDTLPAPRKRLSGLLGYEVPLAGMLLPVGSAVNQGPWCGRRGVVTRMPGSHQVPSPSDPLLRLVAFASALPTAPGVNARLFAPADEKSFDEEPVTQIARRVLRKTYGSRDTLLATLMKTKHEGVAGVHIQGTLPETQISVAALIQRCLRVCHEQAEVLTLASAPIATGIHWLESDYESNLHWPRRNLLQIAGTRFLQIGGAGILVRTLSVERDWDFSIADQIIYQIGNTELNFQSEHRLSSSRLAISSPAAALPGIPVPEFGLCLVLLQHGHLRIAQLPGPKQKHWQGKLAEAGFVKTLWARMNKKESLAVGLKESTSYNLKIRPVSDEGNNAGNVRHDDSLARDLHCHVGVKFS
ncbi:unnamed protein product, partial [Polarella glacialis]